MDAKVDVMWNVFASARYADSLSSDYVRAWSHEESATILMANASRSGFEATNSSLSREMLSQAEGIMRAFSTSSDIDDAFREVSDSSRRLISASQVDDDETAAGWLTVACLTQNQLHALWIGSDEVWVVAGAGDLVYRSLPHVGSRSVAPAGFPDVCMRGFGSSYPGSMPEAIYKQPVESGQRVVVMSRSVWQSAPERELALIASRGDAATACGVLLKVPSERTTRAAVAIAVRA